LIGLRRWSLNELGVNRNGLGLSLACGLALLTGRLLAILSIDFNLEPPYLTLTGMVGDILFYFLLVGLVEELLYRGLVYRALDEWLGVRWAIWGSSLGFGLWHIFGQGPLIGIATLLIGLIFALIRWRAGGILGLIVIHALWDLQAVWLVASSNADILTVIPPTIPHPILLTVGLALMLLVPIYLWKVSPIFQAYAQKRLRGSL
jgi:membrane protease YdiL (CAAX protease family)